MQKGKPFARIKILAGFGRKIKGKEHMHEEKINQQILPGIYKNSTLLLEQILYLPFAKT